MGRNKIKEILANYRTVAVVGLSRDPDKDSYKVSTYLKEHGFRIIPVNPLAEEVLGEKSYGSLLDIPGEIQKSIDIVDVFRPAVDAPLIVEQVVKLRTMYGRPYVVWMQLGIVNMRAADTAKENGLTVVMDKCIMVEHKRLFYTMRHI